MAAATRAQEASSSLSQCPYHVFLSFRGEDTRYTFTDHLHAGLKYAGIHAFRDNDGLDGGGDIAHEIKKAILDSKMSIIVFSKDYASSEWCLDELVMIMERRRTVDHVVFPVFYHVDPEEVSTQSGNFREAFANHEREKEKERVKEWKAAPKEVANLAGEVLKDGYEAQFVQDIVKKVSDKLNRAILHIPPYLVGIDSRVKEINIWLQDTSTKITVAIISGIGGVRKTTIAKTVYNLNFDKFEGRSFLENVRETSEQSTGLIKLQKQLLSDLLNVKTKKVHNVSEGIIRIKNALQNRKVLIVVDDVDQLDQFNTIIGMKEWLYPGSKIIITSRHKRLLKAHEACKLFVVKELDDKESLELFSWHAFGQAYPARGYVEHSEIVVRHYGGLPLALENLGYCLSGTSMDLWERALREPETIDDGKVERILRISYDSLHDDREKNLFLDVACFFFGKDKDYVDKVLGGCDFYRVLGIQNLIDRYLITINERNKLIMHQSLRDMAREIVRQESPEELGKRSRLWRHEDAFVVLRENAGTETIRSLTLDLHLINRGSRKKAEWKTKAFAKMKKLKFLQLNFAVITGEYKIMPKNLIWLSFRGFPMASIPAGFDLEKLVVLDMRNSSLQHAWEGSKSLPKLKILNLSHSHLLVKLPDFRGVTSLEKLILKGCISLVEVDESIGALERLVFFNLKDCKKLKKISNEIGMLKSLQTLILSGCLELDKLPNRLAEMQSLRILHAPGIGINQTVDNMNKSILFSQVLLPQFLVKLRLKNCNLPVDTILNDIRRIASSQYLNPTPSSISPQLESSLAKLGSFLPDWGIGHMLLPGLQSLPDLLTSLRLNLLGCNNLVECQSLFKFGPIPDNQTITIDYMQPFDAKRLSFFDENGNVKYANTKRHISVSVRNDMIITHRKTPIRVLHEFGISSIFYHGSQIPDCYDHRKEGSEISFIVPSIFNRYTGLPSKVTCSLNLCVIYQLSTMDLKEEALRNPSYIVIRNETKGLKWTYSSVWCQGTYVSDSLVELQGIHGPWMWLSHWKLAVGDQLEAGDCVTVSVDMANGFCVQHCGVCTEIKEGITVTTWQEGGNKTNTTDVSAFQMAPHVFSSPLGQQSPSMDITIQFG